MDWKMFTQLLHQTHVQGLPNAAEDAAFDFGWGLFLAHLLLINDYTDYLQLCVYIIYM